MLSELEIWVLELLMRFAQPRFADILQEIIDLSLAI